MDVVKINSLDHYGRGVGKYYNKTIFVENALPGEEVSVKITCNKKNYFEAIVLEYLTKSNSRIVPICPYFNECGGCNLMHMNYSDQLIYKKNKVVEIMNKFAHIDSSFIKDIVYDESLYYRNKITLQVDKDIGLYKKNSSELVIIDKCMIVNQNINMIIEKLKKMVFNNIDKIIIKSSIITNNIMIVFCAYGKIDEEYLVNSLKDENISIIKKYKNEEKCLYGKSNLVEYIKDYKFLISADSFFQVNTKGVEKLYDTVKKYISAGENNVLDLYCGTGTIGIYISSLAKNVYGIEINKSAVKDAIENANLNNVDNIKFICADVKDVIKDYKNIDIIIVDPPRKGLEKEAISNLIKLNASKIIYVSCDPITLARDINILSNNYNLCEITPVDMFPNTYHCESVCILERR